MTGSISAVGLGKRIGTGDTRLLDASLRELADTGADACEISIYAEEIVSGGRIVEERAARIASTLKGYRFKKLSLHGPLTGNFMDRDHPELQKKVMRANLELCNRLGAGVLVQHAGVASLVPGETGAAFVQMEREVLAEMADVARGYGVRIGLENVFTSARNQYCHTPGEVAETVRAIGSRNVMAVTDFSHAYIESTYRNLDFREQLRAMAPVTGHLHVHDSFGKPGITKKFHHPAEAASFGIGDLHLPLGWGDIPWEEIFAELSFLPDTTLIVEVGAERFADEQPASLARARQLAGLSNSRTQQKVSL